MGVGLAAVPVESPVVSPVVVRAERRGVVPVVSPVVVRVVSPVVVRAASPKVVPEVSRAVVPVASLLVTPTGLVRGEHPSIEPSGHPVPRVLRSPRKSTSVSSIRLC